MLLRDGLRISYNYMTVVNREANRTLINIDNESILGKFVKKGKREVPQVLSNENSTNIKISLIHTFFYMYVYSSTLSTNSYLLKSMDTDGIYSGVVMGMTPLMAILSTIFCSKWSITSYKRPMLFTLLCFILGNFTYAFSANFQSVGMLGLGRMLIGLGSGRMVNRRYLIEFVPKSELSKYSLYYIMYGAIGLSTGL
jgi:MFS family permease